MPGAELAACLGQMEEVALTWGWDGGWVVVAADIHVRFSVCVCVCVDASKCEDFHKMKSADVSKC